MARKTTKSKVKIFDTDVVVEEQYYLGNKGLPTSESKYEYTPEMRQSMLRCATDIKYFAENFFTIITPKGRVHIPLRDYQVRFLDTMVKEKRVIMNTSRQIGKTTMMTIFALWLALFKSDQHIVIIANNNNTALAIFDKIRLAYLELPGWLKEPVEEFNKMSLKLTNGSKIVTSPTTDNAIRGQTVSCLILDEFAFVDPGIAEAFWTAVTPTLITNPDAKLFVSSTPNGVGNKFHQLVTDAEDPENEFVVEKVIWSDVPGRDEAWKQKVIKTDLGGDTDKFEQEYECRFLGASNSPFQVSVFEHVEMDIKSPIKTTDEGRLSIWKEPENNRIYSIGVDVGEGLGKDSSVINVFDLTDLNNIEQVAMWCDNLTDSTEFAAKVKEVADLYGNPVLSVERNSIGADVANRLYNDFSYPRMVSYGGSKGSAFLPGVRCTQNTKAPGISNFRRWVCNTYKAHVHDKRFLEELRHFERKRNGTWGAQNGYHDDIIMSTVWALNVLHRNNIKNYFIVDTMDANGDPIKISNKFRYQIKDKSDMLASKYGSGNNVPVIVFGRAQFSGFASIKNPHKIVDETWELLERVGTSRLF